MNHLKEHILFYLGLIQAIAGYLAMDPTLSGPWVKYALAASGLLTIVSKYVKANLPDPSNPISPQAGAGASK